jgi:hypothetical protein
MSPAPQVVPGGAVSGTAVVVVVLAVPVLVAGSLVVVPVLVVVVDEDAPIRDVDIGIGVPSTMVTAPVPLRHMIGNTRVRSPSVNSRLAVNGV